MALRTLIWIFVIKLSFFLGLAQTAEAPPEPAATSSDHAWLNHFWVSGQINLITQMHGDFPAAYSGPNSLQPYWQLASSRVETLYTGVSLPDDFEFLVDVESAGGSGLSNALGLAGFTNLDVVRNPTLGEKPYIARIMLHKTIALSSESMEADRGPFQLASSLPVRRLEFRLGKMSLADFFDVNSVGSDSHLQFMNWVIDNNGAYDYAADTRGYTYAAYVEYQDRNWGVRFAEALMPTVANGLVLDWDLARARSENVEVEIRRSPIPKRQGIVRFLSFVNHANMGSYREAINQYLAAQTAVPDVTATREQGRVKYGFGINAEQELGGGVRAYGRFGWNEGSNESYAYTEVNQAFSGGADVRGRRWGRKDDKAGAAVAINGISGDHRRYLALGGEGFILGDGGLTYGREKIFETYYTAKLWKGLSGALDLQRIWDPGYNQVRGPVWVGSVRLHLEGILLGGR